VKIIRFNGVVLIKTRQIALVWQQYSKKSANYHLKINFSAYFCSRNKNNKNSVNTGALKNKS
jgi:hypothetical protein